MINWVLKKLIFWYNTIFISCWFHIWLLSKLLWLKFSHCSFWRWGTWHLFQIEFPSYSLFRQNPIICKFSFLIIGIISNPIKYNYDILPINPIIRCNSPLQSSNSKYGIDSHLKYFLCLFIIHTQNIWHIKHLPKHTRWWLNHGSLHSCGHLGLECLKLLVVT